MATKPKLKKVGNETKRPQAAKPAGPAKSRQAKPLKPSTKRAIRAPGRTAPAKTAGRTVKAAKAAVQVKKKPAASVAPAASRKSAATVARARTSAPAKSSRQFPSAVQAYEAGIKFMYAEDFRKAIGCFQSLIQDYPEEQEIQANAKARMQACEKKLQGKSRTVLRSADDHYNVGVAFLNRGELESAVSHFEQALKLTPSADHVLYGLAAANARLGNTDQALSCLRQSILRRPENRFQAVQDSDFAALIDEPAFRELLALPEK